MFRIAQNNQKWMCFLLHLFAKQFKTVFKTMIFQKIHDGDLRKISKCSLKIKIYEVLCEKHEFSCSERLRSHIRGNSELELKNRDFWTKNVPSCSSSSKVNMFFTQSLPEAVQNRVQNRDFSENPRWGPYKNRKMFTKNQWARGTLRKTWILRFWTASITYTRQNTVRKL